MAKANPFRFSTKYQDDETDLLYYGYRYYNASTGRWSSRDRLKERGGPNLYAFVGDNPITRVDRLGLSIYYPSSPPAPSRFDHYNPNGLLATPRPGGELNQTAWFESHYAGWTFEMKRRALERVGRR